MSGACRRGRANGICHDGDGDDDVPTFLHFPFLCLQWPFSSRVFPFSYLLSLPFSALSLLVDVLYLLLSQLDPE